MNLFTRIAGGAATALALCALAAPASAGGSLKDKPAEARRCTAAANVAITSDYVFRGISQSAETPAIQGGFDATCGIFYAGVWASSIDFGVAPIAGPDKNIASIEMDFYAGIKPVTGKITWDLGVIYYAYPKAFDPGADLNMVELKVGASGEIWKGGTLGVTGFFSPDYTGENGEVWTVEVGFSQALPAMGKFTPTFSALYGYQSGSDSVYRSNFGDDNYSYWNAGLTFGFEKFSFDVRYWDSNLTEGTVACGTGRTLSCDERVVGTVKFTY